jgi:hypothetical protein
MRLADPHPDVSSQETGPTARRNQPQMMNEEMEEHRPMRAAFRGKRGDLKELLDQRHGEVKCTRLYLSETPDCAAVVEIRLNALEMLSGCVCGTWCPVFLSSINCACLIVVFKRNAFASAETTLS